MVKKGETVVEITKKVGQHARQGTVVEVRGEAVEVKWEDGHTSITSRTALATKTEANEASTHHG